MSGRSSVRLLGLVFTIFTVSLLYSAVALFSIRSVPLEDHGIIEIRHQRGVGAHPKALAIREAQAAPKSAFIEISPRNYAFYAVADGRNGNMGPPQIRILMAIESTDEYTCQYPKGSVVPGKLYEFSENHRKPERAFYLNCPLPENENLDEVDEIKIIHRGNSSAVMGISYRIPPESAVSPDLKLSICVPVIFGAKYTAAHLIEFVEMNRMLGVDMISIYAGADLGGDARKVLEAYELEGIVEVIPYLMPFAPSSIWYYGQLITVTDCLLRHTGRSKFVAFHDLDEYMISQESDGDALVNRIAVLEKLFANAKLGSLRISTLYFDPSVLHPPITLNNMHRVAYADTRFTKCVLRPEYGIHHTSRVIQDDYEIQAVSEKHLNLVHYKKQSQAGVIDNYFSHHFGDRFSEAFHAKIKQFGLQGF
ncbi:unnamed protein product, partial [Mesorhabditis spiculigera]